MDHKTLKNTPVKRLGMSRIRSPRTTSLKSVLKTLEVTNATPDTTAEKPSLENTKDLAELSSKLSGLTEVSELENAIKTWKNGCKDALLDLQAWISAEGTSISCETLSEKLGILPIIQEHFKNDPEIFDV